VRLKPFLRQDNILQKLAILSAFVLSFACQLVIAKDFYLEDRCGNSPSQAHLTIKDGGKFEYQSGKFWNNYSVIQGNIDTRYDRCWHFTPEQYGIGGCGVYDLYKHTLQFDDPDPNDCQVWRECERFAGVSNCE
jgi:hypothetical protein